MKNEFNINGVTYVSERITDFEYLGQHDFGYLNLIVGESGVINIPNEEAFEAFVQNEDMLRPKYAH